jgi:predicted MFS family arabinose efflux permease
MGALVGGLTLANVIGVPLGTAVGEALGWRGPFWILAGLAVAAIPVIARQVPTGGERAYLSVRAEIAALHQVRVWMVFLAFALFEGGMIAAYSYVSPLLSWEEPSSNGQKASSGRSIRSSVAASAIARSVASRGCTVAATKRAAAIFPS